MKNDVSNFIKKNLLSFTGLPKHTLKKYLERDESIPNHKDEWNFWNPKTEEEVNWFYVCSRTYLFNTAIHIMPVYLFNEIRSKCRIFDFGAGIGHITFALAMNKKCKVYYFDINLLQREFVRYVAEKNQLDIEIINYNANYEPIIDKNIYVDYIFAFDVFEHIPNYPKYIKLLSNIMISGSKMYVIAHFDNKEPAHMTDKFGFDNICNNYGLCNKRELGKVSIYIKG